MKILISRKFYLLSIFIIIILIPILFYLSVTISIWPENYFWVERKNATMPVWVKGNINSGVFIIHNHGGPGSSGTLESIIEVYPGNGKLDHPSPLQILEKDYAMVYWDQRHSGMSKGSADPNDSRPEDFGNDLAVVIREIEHRFTVKKIFLIGQSWGHFVATCYMTYVDDWKENQSKVAGFIGYKGVHEHEAAFIAACPKLIAHARMEIQSERDTSYWQDAEYFYQNNTTLTNISDGRKHYDYINSAMGGSFSFYDRVFSSVKASLFSPFNGLPLYFNNKNTMQAKKMLSWVFLDFSMRDVIHRINVPTLLIYGKKDLIAPVEVGQIIYNEIETVSQDKKLVVLSNSRHGAENKDVLILQKAIQNFITKYK